MAPALAHAVVPLRDEEHKTTEHMRRKTARAVKQRNLMAESFTHGCVDDAVAMALGSLVTSTPLPRVEAEGIEYLEPDYRTAKQKKQEKKLAKRLAKQSRSSSEDKVVTKQEPPLPKVTKPKVEKAPIVVPPVTQPKQAAATQGKLDDHHRLDQFTGLLKSAGAETAMMFLKDCFGVAEASTRDSDRVSAHREALMMQYIKDHVSTLQAVSLSIEQRPYGGVNPCFVEYKTRRTESMWQHHNGPMVTQWGGKPYLVSESIGRWVALGTDEEKHVVTKSKHGHRLPIGLLQWLEQGDEFDYVRCDLGVGTEHHNFTVQTFTHNTPLLVGDLRVGVQCRTESVAVPQVSEATRDARKARVIRGKISEHAVAGRLAEAQGSNVVAVDFIKKEKMVTAESAASVANVSEPAANDEVGTNDLPLPRVKGKVVEHTAPLYPEPKSRNPDHILDVAKVTVDRNHQRMLAFRDSTLTRMLPRYVVHNTETVPVTTQTVLQDLPVMVAPKPDTRNTLTLMGEFTAPPVARKKVARNDDVRSMTTATDAAYQTWCNGRESRAAWELEKATQARYMDHRLSEAWLVRPKRVGLPLDNGSLTKAERLNRLGATRLMNEPEYNILDLKLISERDDVRYEEWAFHPDKPKTDLQLWFLRTEWLSGVHHEFTTMDMAYACVRTTVAGDHNVGDTVSCYGKSLDEVKSAIILPAAGLELSGQGEALVVDMAGHELVADKPLIVTKPDTTTVKEESLFSQIMASVPGAMTEVQSALVKAIDIGVPVSEVRRLVSQYSLESDGGILVA